MAKRRAPRVAPKSSPPAYDEPVVKTIAEPEVGADEVAVELLNDRYEVVRKVAVGAPPQYGISVDGVSYTLYRHVDGGSAQYVRMWPPALKGQRGK